jgi:PAS domain S-box-containing protein
LKATTKALAPLAGAAVLAALVVAASFWAFRQIELAAEARGHSYDLIIRANALLSDLTDAETGQRGFALTGDDAFLPAYATARDNVAGNLRNMRALTQIDAARRNLEALVPLVDARMAEMAGVIESRRRLDTAAKLSAVDSSRDKRLMMSIRAEIDSYTSVQEDALVQHEATFKANMRHLFAVIVASSVLALALTLWFAHLIRRDVRQRLKNLVHVETRQILDAQEETNRQLRLANATLQVSEEKLTVTLNSIGDAVMTTDREGRVTLLNPLAQQLTGWTQAEAAGRPVEEIFRIINQETREPSAVPVTSTLANGTIQGLANHTILIARDGTERTIADSCAPICERDGRVVGAVLVFRDVTSTDAARLALRDSATLIQAILNTAVDGIITLHASGGLIERANAAAERMFGYAADEIAGKPFSLLIPELGQDQQYGSLDYYAASDESLAAGRGREVAGQRKDGSAFPLEIAVSELWLGGKRYFTGILRDITARKQAEAEQSQLSQRLRDHQFYTRSLFESNIDALMTTNPAGIITDVNRQMEELTGATRDELIGAPFKGYFTDPERAETGIKLVLAEKTVTDYELTARARDGKETVVSYNAATIYDRERRLQGVFAAARDITDRKRLDRVLQERNAELENARLVADKANLAKSDFLSSMSHELRTPLNAILGFAQLMETGSPPPTPSQKRNVEQILKAGWYLLELINEILDLALIESGKVTLSAEPVSLVEVMLECRAMVEPQAHKRGIGMTFPRFDVPQFVSADRMRVKQVLINLLFNAVKYNRPGGTVTVECLESAPNSVRISVRDTGAGLTPEQIAQLFHPFNRLGKENGAEEGTGIGLVVTKRLVELMGGAIGVESAVGVGSVFWIELHLTTAPLLAGHESEQSALTRPQLPVGALQRTLLYVEDNPANLELVEQIIARRLDLRLLSAADGDLGIEFARAYLPDVILMDIHLPGMNGIEAMGILRADPSTMHIPIIALSANAVPRDIEKALEAGFFNYLTKPIKVTQFNDALDLALKHSQSATSRSATKEAA